jgi:hypothetical protein
MIDFDFDEMPVRLTPEQLEAVNNWKRRMAEYQLEERRTVLRFAPVLCRCTRWYDHQYPQAPQQECALHSSIALNPFTGGWL